MRTTWGEHVTRARRTRRQALRDDGVMAEIDALVARLIG